MGKRSHPCQSKSHALQSLRLLGHATFPGHRHTAPPTPTGTYMLQADGLGSRRVVVVK